MLSRELLKRIRTIEIVTERLVRDRMAGQYHSVFKGSGISFSEVRQYAPGDDIRRIDWNVSSRMNDTYVKLFTEEREMTVLLLVDMSASGRFGSRVRQKRDLAAELAAVLAFSAIRNNDRVGLIIFTDEVEKFVPPKKGKRHVLRVVSEFLSFQEKSKRTSLGAGLEFLSHVVRRKAVAFLISDFLSPVDSYERALRVTARRHDLIPVRIGDPLEEALPNVGLVELEDPDPDAPTVAARVDRAEAHVGDPIHLELVAIGKSAVPVNLPSTLELGPFSLLDRQESEQNLGDGRLKRQFTLTIAAYEPGSKQVPAIEVTYLGPRGDVRTARTSPVTVKIGSLTANEPEPAIKEAAPPVRRMAAMRGPAH